MRKMLLLSIWLFSAVRCKHPKIHLSAQEGGVVNIPCRYDSGYEKYPKYLYKGIYGEKRIIKSTDKKFKDTTQKGKYSLWDDTKERILHVTIHSLTLNDGGMYWCEIDAYTFDPKTEINLKVLKAPAPLKPPLVTSNPPISTTVQAITRNQQQSAGTTVTESASSTTLWSTPPEHVHTVLPSLAGKKLYLVAAAAPLLCLLVVLYFTLRKHRQDEARVFGRAVSPLINTSSTLNNIYGETHSRGQLRELNPSVSTSFPDSTYAAVISRRGPDAHTSIGHPVTIRTRMANPVSNSSISSCLQDDASAPVICQDEENICSVSSPSTEAGDRHNSEDIHLLYSTVCFNTEAATQSRSQIRSAAGPSEVYATIRRP